VVVVVVVAVVVVVLLFVVVVAVADDVFDDVVGSFSFSFSFLKCDGRKRSVCMSYARCAPCLCACVYALSVYVPCMSLCVCIYVCM